MEPPFSHWLDRLMWRLRKPILVATFIAAPVVLLFIGWSVRTLGETYGLPAMVVAVAAFVIVCLALAGLLERRR